MVRAVVMESTMRSFQLLKTRNFWESDQLVLAFELQSLNLYIHPSGTLVVESCEARWIFQFQFQRKLILFIPTTHDTPITRVEALQHPKHRNRIGSLAVKSGEIRCGPQRLIYTCHITSSYSRSFAIFKTSKRLSSQLWNWMPCSGLDLPYRFPTNLHLQPHLHLLQSQLRQKVNNFLVTTQSSWLPGQRVNSQSGPELELDVNVTLKAILIR